MVSQKNALLTIHICEVLESLNHPDFRQSGVSGQLSLHPSLLLLLLAFLYTLHTDTNKISSLLAISVAVLVVKMSPPVAGLTCLNKAEKCISHMTTVCIDMCLTLMPLLKAKRKCSMETSQSITTDNGPHLSISSEVG